MEISEFLTRIDLKGADGTLFRKEERELTILNGTEKKVETKTGINIYTKFDNGSSAVTGFILYDKDFPSQTFKMSPNLLKKILEQTDNITLEDTFLVGHAPDGNIFEDIEPDEWKTINIKYTNKPIKIKKDIISKILKRSEIIDPNKITLVSDGQQMVITLYSKIGSSKSEIKFDCDVVVSAEPQSTTFFNILDRIGENDVNLLIDNDNSKKPIKLEISDKNAVIAYYVMNTYTEEKPVVKKKKEVPKKQDEDEEESQQGEETIDLGL